MTADDNSAGKSTLVKLLLWGLGCEPSLDSLWNALDCSTIIRFQIADAEYEVMRYKDAISMIEPNRTEIQRYSKITGEYSRKFSEITSFGARITNRKGEPEIPPPAFFFIPFYIDQIKSWSKAWNNFEKLDQYANWKPTLLKYHLGLLPSEHFEIEFEKYQSKSKQEVLLSDISKLQATLEVVPAYIPALPNSVTVDSEKFTVMKDEIRKELAQLAEKQEKLLDELTKMQSDRAFLDHQKAVAESIVRNLEADYKFSVENIEGITIECPLCGTLHENSVFNKASILKDKFDAESQLKSLEEDLFLTTSKLERTKAKLDKLQVDIDVINSKYAIQDAETAVIDTSSIIEGVASSILQERVSKSRNEKLGEEKEIRKTLRTLNKEQKSYYSKENEESIVNEFLNTFSSYLKGLEAGNLNLAEIKSPLSYQVIEKEGGAAEGARLMLAYYMSVYSVVYRHGSSAKSALIIDTPNQQEQSHTNYERIINLIIEKFPLDSQIILCAMDNPQLEPFSRNANVIRLNSDKLLSSNAYESVKKEFERFN